MISGLVGVLSDLVRGGRMTAYNVVRSEPGEPVEVVPVALVDDVALLQADVVRLSRELGEVRAREAGWKAQLDAAIEAREQADTRLEELDRVTRVCERCSLPFTDDEWDAAHYGDVGRVHEGCCYLCEGAGCGVD